MATPESDTAPVKRSSLPPFPGWKGRGAVHGLSDRFRNRLQGPTARVVETLVQQEDLPAGQPQFMQLNHETMQGSWRQSPSEQCLQMSSAQIKFEPSIAPKGRGLEVQDARSLAHSTRPGNR